MSITIEKLARPEHDGDWHDKPLKWVVKGPDQEVQKFSTKKDATLYKRIRRTAVNFNQASADFAILDLI